MGICMYVAMHMYVLVNIIKTHSVLYYLESLNSISLDPLS